MNRAARKRCVRQSKAQAAAGAKLPGFVRPQLATLVDWVPEGKEWLHEIKFDGYRLLCRVDNGRVRFLTRQAQDWTAFFPALAGAAKALPVHQALLDGEVVAVDQHGKSHFQNLQNALKHADGAPLIYYAFDLLHVNGTDFRDLPLRARKAALQKLFPAQKQGAIRYSQHWENGHALFQESCRRGLEGIISKRADAPYRSERSRDWLKIKCVQRQEFVIGGFTEPAGSRSGLGALLLGVFDERGDLRYAGRVGTGFSQASLAQLRAQLDSLEQPAAPFTDAPRGRLSRGVHWVKPTLVAEVAFTEWTEDNLLRHPSFQGLREDKAPGTVVREQAARLPLGC